MAVLLVRVDLLLLASCGRPRPPMLLGFRLHLHPVAVAAGRNPRSPPVPWTASASTRPLTGTYGAPRSGRRPPPPAAPSPPPRPKRLNSDSSSEGNSGAASSEVDDTFWITWFCGMRGNEFFTEVDDDYIQDDFNLCGLSNQFPYYDHALTSSSTSSPFRHDHNQASAGALAEQLRGLRHYPNAIKEQLHACNITNLTRMQGEETLSHGEQQL